MLHDKRSTLGVLVCVILAGHVFAADRAAGQRIPQAASCESCGVSVRAVASIGGANQPLPDVPRSILNHAGFYWLLFGDQVLVYDSSGSLHGTVGRRGQGPGEFLEAALVLPVAGDSVAVFDQNNLRITVIGRDLKVGRTASVGVAVTDMRIVRWPDQILINGLVDQTDRFGWSLHWASLSTSQLAYHRSFGHGGGEIRPNEWGRTLQVISRGSETWVADRLRYRLTLWTDSGIARRVLERDAPWFPQASFPGRGGPNHPPTTMVAAVAQDERTLLWVYLLTPADNWRDAWRGVPRGMGAGERSARRGPEGTELYQTVVEVIDPASARVVTRGTVPGVILGVTGPNTIATVSTDAAGEQRITIYSVLLRRQ